MSDQANIERVANWLRESAANVAFTGAGISTDSGIPDFRSPTGVWARIKPIYFDDFLASAAARHASWRQKSEAHREFASAQPNAGHRILAAWEARGRIAALVTQNIDGLHQAAGSRDPIELHGTARQIACLGCHARYAPEPLIEEFRRRDVVPDCPACGGLLKSATISFGQPLDPATLERATAAAHAAELLLAIGSSLVVEPAASLPRMAKRQGARLVIVNGEATPLDPLADVVLRGSISELLAAVDSAL